uniref:aminopeptidase P family N-terminal domain-containing protein n=1 Tax=Candidatus Pelagibacter sp. TaxID=2024849 RepID=UPI00404B2E1B
MIKNKINILRKKFNKYKIDGYIIPKNDDYFSEYAKNDRLRTITKFSGSAGIAVILKKNNYLFVDGRYTIQAQQESSKNFNIIEIHKKLPHKIIKNYTLGYDPSLFTNNTLNKYFAHNKLVLINQNLIDQISTFNEKKTKPFYSLEKKIVGETHQSKISKIVKFLNSNKADYLFVSAPENVAWLLNIRGHDNPNSPIPNARLIIHKNKKIYLITEKTKAFNIIKEKKIKKNQIINNNDFLTLINQLPGGAL